MTSAATFVAGLDGLGPDAVRDAFFRFIDIEPRSVDISTARHAEFMLEVSGLDRARPRLSLEALIVRYLAPEAALYKRVSRARALLLEVEDPYYRAHGYREVFERTRDPEDLAQLILTATTIDRGPGFKLGDGAARLPEDGLKILIEAYALAAAYDIDDLRGVAYELIPPEDRQNADAQAEAYKDWEGAAQQRYLRHLAEGFM